MSTRGVDREGSDKLTHEQVIRYAELDASLTRSRNIVENTVHSLTLQVGAGMYLICRKNKAGQILTGSGWAQLEISDGHRIWRFGSKYGVTSTGDHDFQQYLSDNNYVLWSTSFEAELIAMPELPAS